MLRSDLATLKSLNYDGRMVIQGRSGGKQAWGDLTWEGQTEETVNDLPDGRRLRDVLEAGDLASLPTCWIRVVNTGAYGDMIWAGAMMFCFVSDRFVKAIEEAGFGGYQLLPLPVQPKRGDRFPGYSLLLPDNHDPDAPIRSFPFVYRPTVALDVSADVMAALTEAGATAFDKEDALRSAMRLVE